LIGEEITIGRASDNGICIGDDSISDHHAVINRQNGNCILRDLQSAKGTTVRGNKIIVVTLEDSDRVAFGSVEAEFTTTEVKLHMPKTAVLPPPPTQPTWPQRRGVPAAARGSSFKSAVLTLVQLAAVVALAYGGYWWYQKLSKVDPNDDSPQTVNAKEASLRALRDTASPPPQSTAGASLSPAPPVSTAPAAVPESVASPSVAAQVVARVVSVPPNPAIQQARLLIAQNKYQDAIVSLDKIVASATNPAVVAEAQAPLKEALNAQLSSLQATKQQWQAQCKLVEDRLKAAKDQLVQDTKALEKKKADEERIYQTSGGRWFNGRWVYNTRKGTGDSSAQSVIQGLQIKVMTDSQEVKKQTDIVSRYQPQIIAFDQQIAAIQVRLTQVEASLNSQSNSGTERVQSTVPATPVSPAPAPAPMPAPSEAAPAPAPSAAAVAAPQSSSASVELGELKPEDWVRSLPAQAQMAYLLGFNQQGTTRIDSLRHWLSLWGRHMQDPNLTLLEMDYIKHVIQYRDPSIDRILEEARRHGDHMSKSEWANIQLIVTRKMSDLNSAGNKLIAMNIRSGKQPALAKLIGEGINLATRERTDMNEIFEHYKSLCHAHHWHYSWYW